MNPYATSFLLFLYQLSLGGLFALSVTPFFELERGFYKSTTAVLVVTSGLAFWGQIDLLSQGGGILVYLSLFFLGTFALFLIFYFILLWGERGFLRARCYSIALFAGLAGLIVFSLLFIQSPRGILEIVLLSLGSILSAALLGAVTVGMLIGHWYLIDTGQSLEPFYRVFKFFVAILIIQTAYQWIAAGILYAFGEAITVSALERIVNQHSVLLASRFLVAQVGPLALSYMIWKTLKDFRNTMAATGLFYIALLGVFVGALLSLQILALTLLPL
jgi:hypothetical protein